MDDDYVIVEQAAAKCFEHQHRSQSNSRASEGDGITITRSSARVRRKFSFERSVVTRCEEFQRKPHSRRSIFGETSDESP